jgi:hypothetical protein
MKFLKIFTLLDFVTKFNFEKLNKSSRKHQQGGNLRDRDNYSHEKSSKILNRRKVPKIYFFCFTVLLEGGDETRGLSLISYNSNRQQCQLIVSKKPMAKKYPHSLFNRHCTEIVYVILSMCAVLYSI